MYHPRRNLWLAILIIVAFALRLVLCTTGEGLGHFTGRSYSEYVVAGQHLLETGTLVSPLIREFTPQEPSVLMPPVYVGLVAGVYGLLGVRTFAATLTLQLINVVATSLAVALTFSVASRVGGTRSGWVAAVLIVFNPLLIGFTNYMWDTSLFTLAVIITVWISLRMGEKATRTWEWLGLGLWLGVVALLSPALTLAYPLLVLWPATKSRGWRLESMVKPACLTICGWLIAITPWTIRNYVQVGELTYIRGGFPLELWLGVCPEADENPAAVYPAQFPLLNKDAQHLISSIGEGAYIKQCGERANAAISADPLRYIKLVVIRAVDYFAGTTYSHASPGGGGWPKQPLRAIVMLFLLLETLVILVCLLAYRRVGRDVPWLLAMVVTFSIVYCLTHVQIRFRSPMEPVVAVVLASIVTGYYQAWTERRRLRAEFQSRS